MRALLASPVLPSIALCYVHAKFQLELEDHEIFMKNDVVIVEQLEQEQLANPNGRNGPLLLSATRLANLALGHWQSLRKIDCLGFHRSGYPVMPSSCD